MPNTRQAAKRVRQSLKKQDRNQVVKSTTKTAVRKALTAISQKGETAQTAYREAIRALSKAASKGVIAKGKAARKISRLTLMAKKVHPEAVQPSNKS